VTVPFCSIYSSIHGSLGIQTTRGQFTAVVGQSSIFTGCPSSVVAVSFCVMGAVLKPLTGHSVLIPGQMPELRSRFSHRRTGRLIPNPSVGQVANTVTNFRNIAMSIELRHGKPEAL
jgi:hypothetical protein